MCIGIVEDISKSFMKKKPSVKETDHCFTPQTILVQMLEKEVAVRFLWGSQADHALKALEEEWTTQS